MSEKPKSADEVRRVFGENLKELASTSRSIAQLCRELGINRTQFNRYLHGEAFPRPDILQKICTHFGRDARILLESLREIDGPSASQAPTEIDGRAFFSKIISFDHDRIPDGLYRLITPSFITETGVSVSLIRLYRVSNGGKAIVWNVPREFAARTGQSTHWKDLKQTGYCFQHTDGFSASVTSNYSSYIVNSFFSYGHHGDTNLHTGFGTITQSRGPGRAQAHPAMLERIRGGLAGAIRARRDAGMKSMEELDPVYRDYLETWTPR